MKIPSSRVLIGVVIVMTLSIVTAIVALLFGPSPSAVEKVHIHAGFQVYVNGTKQDFSEMKYMKVEPCTTKERKLSAEEEQMEKAHLHDQVGDVAHIHRSQATWGDFFKNIGYSFDSNKEIVAYDGDQKLNDFLKTEIRADQSIVVVVGDQSKASDYVKDRITSERIKEVEQMSEKCGADEH